MIVAFQGERGAFSEEAVRVLFGDRAELSPRRENREVAAAVASGEATHGVLPLENSLAGTVAASYDAVVSHPGVFAIAECTLAIHHAVMAPDGATLQSLRVVESHPVALAQCRRFFEEHPQLSARAAYDTAGAARDVATANDPTRGAIAAEIAAHHYGLRVLARHVEDRPDNSTRFIAIGREPVAPPDGAPARTLLYVATENVPGALLRVLEPLASRDLNLSKLESRPTGDPWQYRFVVEFEHDAGAQAATDAIEAVRAASRSCDVLGTVERRA